MEIEIETKETKVTAVVSNFRGFTNVIQIHLHEVIDEVIHELTEDESRMETQIGSYYRVQSLPILLESRGSFTVHHISQLLRDQHVPDSQDIGQCIAHGVDQLSANNNISLLDPLFVTVHVMLTKELRFIFPPSAPSLRGASLEVFLRLAQEQRVELPKDSKETCSICMENLSSQQGTSDQNYITQMPECLHLIHEKCLFEWIARNNSCPLCRKVPYELEH